MIWRKRKVQGAVETCLRYDLKVNRCFPVRPKFQLQQARAVALLSRLIDAVSATLRMERRRTLNVLLICFTFWFHQDSTMQILLYEAPDQAIKTTFGRLWAKTNYNHPFLDIVILYTVKLLFSSSSHTTLIWTRTRVLESFCHHLPP